MHEALTPLRRHSQKSGSKASASQLRNNFNINIEKSTITLRTCHSYGIQLRSMRLLHDPWIIKFLISAPHTTPFRKLIRPFNPYKPPSAQSTLDLTTVTSQAPLSQPQIRFTIKMSSSQQPQREAYSLPTSQQSASQTSNANAYTAFSSGAAAGEGSSDPLTQYLCGECNSKVSLARGDAIRCKECGHRVLYKERTKRMVQFEAR
jgi:DNA-directed RNA polymerases I, II, and III subunit RPABC4